MVQFDKRGFGKDNRIAKHKQPLFRKILIPMMTLLVLEILLLVGSVLGQGVISELNANEQAILDEKISARKTYLENEMVNNWMNLQYTAEIINAKAESLLTQGRIEIDEMDDNSASGEPLLSEIAEDLINMMRTNRVTGAFIVLNSEDLDPAMESGEYKNKPGIYLRDNNPVSQASFRNQDLLIECSSVNLVHQLGIATDTTWNTQFEFKGQEQPYYDFLYKPCQMAYENKGKYNMMDMGYWSGSYELFREGHKAISYSIPLLFSDGTVYGVLGVDITLDYLRTLLPYDELKSSNENVAYALGMGEEKDGKLKNVLINGPALEKKVEKGGEFFTSSKYYTHSEHLNIYSKNAPFALENWVLAGVVPVKDITEFARTIEITMLIAIIITLLIGLAGNLIVSYKIVKPVHNMSKEIAGKDPGKKISLTATGILEIDQMAESIEKLSADVIDTANRFTQIIEMASVKLAGFQLNMVEQKLFVTTRFFDIFGRDDWNKENMSVQEFNERIKSFDQYFLEEDGPTGGYIYKIPDGREYRFIRIRYVESGHNCYGLVEDVTQTVLEKNILRHERDHDPLTNLYNRRAFRRLIQEVFEEGGERIKIAALLMLDLDNLKYINDTYGHDYGDRYITKAAQVIRDIRLERVISARISGDEFNLFIYGYNTKEEIRKIISHMKKRLNQAGIELPDGRIQKIRLSGGVAWYPQDSTSYDTLLRYSDYAMYAVKNQLKGEIGDFNLQRYQSDKSFLKNKTALIKLIETRAVKYALQPIVDAHTGEIFACEALMRPALAEFKSVAEVLEVARREGKLNQVEELTWFESVEAFRAQEQAGKIKEDVLLFINSIPNQKMTVDKEQLFAAKYRDYLKRIVMELTEEEQMPKDVWEGKKKCLERWNCRIALDDYGTGYNSENILIHVSPAFIKVDIAIVQDIHRNVDKQEVVEYIVNYAHQRGKYIIAEGVETREETEEVIRLGVDYLQGYYVAKPDFTVPDINKDALDTIQKMKEER